MKTDLGLYCHLPFCLKKCAYCDFYSGPFYSLADRYIDALLKEAARYQDLFNDRSVSTLYFGGGTPSSLTSDQLSRLIGGLLKIVSLSPDAEITLEANPATLDAEKLTTLQHLGVNRISLGLQSTDDRELKTLSRLHDFQAFSDTYRLVRRYFDNVSLDLMYGLPDQTLLSFQKSLKTVVSLDPSHISMYALKIEEGTSFYEKRDILPFPSDDAVSDMYLWGCSFLESQGYYQYEISNFAKHGSYSRHNLRYWQGKEYIGLGPAAHSYAGNERYANLADIHCYLDCLENDRSVIKTESYRLSEEELLEEAIILPLRLTSGLDTEKLLKTFGYDLMSKHNTLISRCLDSEYMTLCDGILAFTPKGFLVSNSILSELIP